MLYEVITQIPVAYVYLVIPVSGVFMCLRYLLILSDLIRKRDYHAPDAAVSTR